MPTLTVFDPIFNHKTIPIKVGLASLIRLRLDGSYVAYEKITKITKDKIFFVGYYLIRCKLCHFHYLAQCRDINRDRETENCPYCKGQKIESELLIKV